jgi:hypothetical protein
MRKSTVVIFNQLNIKSNKNDKDNLKKIHKKNHIGKHRSNQRCFKEKKLNCQLAQYEKNKFDKNIFEKKISINRTCGETL